MCVYIYILAKSRCTGSLCDGRARQRIIVGSLYYCVGAFGSKVSLTKPRLTVLGS